MASSTNHQEQSNHSGAAVAATSAATSQNDMNLQQEQQQELIKLLAQHFHHQFYQLTSNGSNNTYNNINNVDTVSNDRSQNSSGNRQSPLYHQAASAAAAVHQQQGTFPSQSLDFALLASTTASGGFDGLNQSINLISPSSTSTTPTSSSNTHSQLLHNHNHLRSQPNTGTNLTTISNVGPESLADFATLGQNLYSLSDLNLISALGMNNLTSNQLVLSLQQQSLLQAAAARQYELNRNFKVEEQFQLQQIRQHHHHQQLQEQQQQQQQQLHRAGIVTAVRQNILDKRNNSNDIIDPEDNNNPVEVQKGMLKFSINTILGRGSPQSMSTSETFNSSNSFSGEQANKLNRLKSFANCKEDRYQQPITVDCDPSIESSDDGDDHDDDDSNSTTINSTPRPQSMNNSNSIILNQSPTINTNATTTTTTVATLHDHHHRANQLANTLNSLSNNHQQTLRHPAQQHPHAHHHHHHPHPHHTSLPFLPGSTAFPWTVAARGKPRRGMMRRAVFSDSQRVGLEKRFQLQKYISKPDRKKLAEKLGLRDSQVKIWFQNRRMKWRNSKERELLSAGGSREQTLPTRNNPNPDLSDVGETIKRLTATNTTVSLAK